MYPIIFFAFLTSTGKGISDWAEHFVLYRRNTFPFDSVTTPPPQLNFIRADFILPVVGVGIGQKKINYSFQHTNKYPQCFCWVMNIVSRIWTSWQDLYEVFCWRLFSCFKCAWCMRLKSYLSISYCCCTLLIENCQTCFCEMDGKIPSELLWFPLFCCSFRPSSSSK